MHTVYSIKKKKYSKKYFVNFVDFTYDSVELCLDVIMKFGITKDSKLDDKTILEAIEDQNLKDAKLAAYNFVSYKPRSEFEVREKLKTKDFNKSSIDFAVSFLYEFKLLNDEEFSRNYIKSYISNKPSGKYKLTQELRKRGITEGIISETIRNFYPDEDTLELALTAANKHLRKISYKPKEKQRKLISDFLSRRGFEWNIITETIEKIFK